MENLINDKERACLSRLLWYRYQYAYWNWPGTISTTLGPHRKSCQRFYEERWASSLTQIQALDLSGEEAALANIIQKSSKSLNMLTEDSFFHFEILGTVPWNPSLVSWGQGQLASTDTGLYKHQFSREFLEKTPPQGLWLKRARSCSAAGHYTKASTIVRIGKYLLSAVGDNEISNQVRGLYSRVVYR